VGLEEETLIPRSHPQHINPERKAAGAQAPAAFCLNQANQNAAQSGAVHVHLLPAAIQLSPDPCFAAAGCHGISVHQLLREARVAHHDGIVTQPTQVRTCHGHIHCR